MRANWSLLTLMRRLLKLLKGTVGWLPPGASHVLRGWELAAPLRDFPEGSGAGGRARLPGPVPSLVNRDYLMKAPHTHPQRTAYGPLFIKNIFTCHRAEP